MNKTGENIRCWICGSDNIKKLFNNTALTALKPEDVAVSNDEYGKTLPLYRCSSCTFVFAGQLPENLLELYSNLEDDEYINSLKARYKEMKFILNKSLKTHTNAGTILEVGSGAGLLISAANKRGLSTTGVEPSTFFVNKAKELFDINLLTGSVPHPELNGKTFDMVFAIDVLEHVPDPIGFLNILKSYMHNNSTMVIVTPDIGSIASKYLKHKWWHFRIAHIGYFNKTTIQKSAEKCGLKVTSIKRPVWYLPFEYLLKRLSKYLPVGFLVKILGRFKALASLPVRFNLHDSIMVFLKKEDRQN